MRMEEKERGNGVMLHETSSASIRKWGSYLANFDNGPREFEKKKEIQSSRNI
jgi:hypothetical protein